MRLHLWPDSPEQEHRSEIAQELDGGETLPIFLPVDVGEVITGFVEASIHRDLHGGDGGPVGYLEGWFVAEPYRQRGVGRALVEAAEAWARARGFVTMCSDADEHNGVSIEAHRRLGYREIARRGGEVLFARGL